METDNEHFATNASHEKSELGALKTSTKVVEAYYDLDSGKVEFLKR